MEPQYIRTAKDLQERVDELDFLLECEIDPDLKETAEALEAWLKMALKIDA